MDTGTGKIITFESEEDLNKELERRNADVTVAPLRKLKRLPKRNCKWCHGKGNIGLNLLTNEYVPCKCVL